MMIYEGFTKRTQGELTQSDAKGVHAKGRRGFHAENAKGVHAKGRRGNIRIILKL